MSYCCVPECTGRGGYHFPKDKLLRSKWIVAVRRQNLKLQPRTTVCHLHFKPEDFKSDVNYLGLSCFTNQIIGLYSLAFSILLVWPRPYTQTIYILVPTDQCYDLPLRIWLGGQWALIDTAMCYFGGSLSR